MHMKLEISSVAILVLILPTRWGWGDHPLCSRAETCIVEWAEGSGCCVSLIHVFNQPSAQQWGLRLPGGY